ncbi:MAG: hypothetical protein NTZ53_03390 [Cyanobacteria bacterium]|nr:hypothetical protein [Cyanobacteriota bacterium]
MSSNPELSSSRTPISDGLASDLQALGSILGSHMRGLDEHLGRQQQRLVLREERLIQDSCELLPAAAVDLESLSKEALRDLCRQHKLTGWSRLRRDLLIDLLKKSIATDPEDSPERELLTNATSQPGSVRREAASRSERLLLLLLDHLQVPPLLIEDAWQGPLRR